MLLSQKLKRDHQSGDFGNALEGYSEIAQEMEMIVDAVAHTGVDFGYGPFSIDEGHINQAREVMEKMK